MTQFYSNQIEYYRVRLRQRSQHSLTQISRFLEKFQDAKSYPLTELDPYGGVLLNHDTVLNVQSRWPALTDVLQEEGLLLTKHSHGGRYFAADPCMYVRPPSWRARRLLADSRIRRLIKALPRFVDPGSLDYPGWLVLIAALELVRTDACTILWNILQISKQVDWDALESAAPTLRATAQATLDLLLGPNCGHAIPLRDRIPLPLALDPTGVDPDASNFSLVRARRASDNTSLIWASLLKMKDDKILPDHCWAFGASFGAIDLGFIVAEALSRQGVDAKGSVVAVGGHSTENIRADKWILWPSGPPPQYILFCDDSITTGRTFQRFLAICHRRYPEAEVRSFILTYDLNEQWNQDKEAERRFELARYATAPARWSKSSSPKPIRFETTEDLQASLLASSDEGLRWIARTQSETLHVLNLHESPFVFGSVNLDLFQTQHNGQQETLGGMAFNAWRALHNLGDRPKLLASLGDDKDGARVLAALRKAGVPTKYIYCISGTRTGRATYLLDVSGTQLVSLLLQPALGMERLTAALNSGAPVLAMGGYPTDVAALADGRPLLWNPGLGLINKGQSEVAWPQVDVLFVNEREWVAYREIQGPAMPITVVTKHKQGAEVLANGKVVARSVPPAEVEGIDIGAGDYFAGAFTHAWLRGWPLPDCLHLATNEAVRFLHKQERFTL